MPTKNSKRKSAKDGGSERAMVAAVLLLAVPVAALSVAFALAVLTVPVLAFSWTKGVAKMWKSAIEATFGNRQSIG